MTLDAEGRRLALADAVAEALDRPSRRSRGASVHGPALTPRETEVARLVARGLSNREVAAGCSCPCGPWTSMSTAS